LPTAKNIMALTICWRPIWLAAVGNAGQGFPSSIPQAGEQISAFPAGILLNMVSIGPSMQWINRIYCMVATII